MLPGPGAHQPAHTHHLLPLHPLLAETICERQRARSAWLPPSWQGWRSVQRRWPRPLAPVSSPAPTGSIHHIRIPAPVSARSAGSHTTLGFSSVPHPDSSGSSYSTDSTKALALEGPEHWACPAPKHTCCWASPSLAPTPLAPQRGLSPSCLSLGK